MGVVVPEDGEAHARIVERQQKEFWLVRKSIVFSGLALVWLGILLIGLKVGSLISFSVEVFGLSVNAVESGILASVFGLLLVTTGVQMKQNLYR